MQFILIVDWARSWQMLFIQMTLEDVQIILMDELFIIWKSGMN